MSSGERNSLKVFCNLQCVCIGKTEFDENFTQEEKNPADSKYDVRLDAWDPPHPDNL